MLLSAALYHFLDIDFYRFFSTDLQQIRRGAHWSCRLQKVKHDTLQLCGPFCILQCDERVCTMHEVVAPEQCTHFLLFLQCLQVLLLSFLKLNWLVFMAWVFYLWKPFEFRCFMLSVANNLPWKTHCGLYTPWWFSVQVKPNFM